MSGPMASVDGWRTTLRSIRWSPLLLAPVVASVALVVVAAVSQGAGGAVGLVADAGLALTAVVTAFIADDPTLEAAPATPIEARARLVARAAAAVPVAVVGWLLVLTVYDSITPEPAAIDLAGRALAALGLGSAALALAALTGRFQSVVSPGAAAVGAMACAGVASRALPGRWLEALPAAHAAWPATVLLALITVAVATTEPVRS